MAAIRFEVAAHSMAADGGAMCQGRALDLEMNIFFCKICPRPLCELLEGAALLVEERAELGAASIAGPQVCAGPWEVGASGLLGRQLPSRCDLRQP
jgi:hypothetical protein